MTTGRLANLAGIARQHAQTRIVSPYEVHPETRGRLKTEKRARVLDGSPGSTPRHISTSPSTAILFGRAVSWMLNRKKRLSDPETPEDSPFSLPIEVIPGLAEMHLQHEGFRALHVAGARGEAVRIRYRSATSDNIIMTVSPHALVTGGPREHFRCFVDELAADGRPGRPLALGMSGRYWADIVPYRVLEVLGPVPEAYVGKGGDLDWNELEDVKFRIAADLDNSISALINAEMNGVDGYNYPEYVMKNVRRAMTKYVERQLCWRIGDEPIRVWHRVP